MRDKHEHDLYVYEAQRLRCLMPPKATNEHQRSLLRECVRVLEKYGDNAIAAEAVTLWIDNNRTAPTPRDLLIYCEAIRFHPDLVGRTDADVDTVAFFWNMAKHDHMELASLGQ